MTNNSNQNGEQVLALANRLVAASSFMDMKEYAVELCVCEEIDSGIMYLALGAATLINEEANKID